MSLPLRRLIALVLDLFLLALVLVAVSRSLPEGPPPVDAMAFFSAQDFKNYFTLVVICLLLSAVRVLPAPRSDRTLSPGDWLMHLKLVRLDWLRPTPIDRLKRWARGLVPLLLVLVPGPLISLSLGWLLAHHTHGAFTTPDDLMTRAGLPGWLRYTLHGLSFAALGAAVLHLVFMPVARRISRSDQHNLTNLDKRSGTTHAASDV
ncbi:MAG: RDD family protein [Rubrivivax sp.]|nr:RDD family protein [Rubrivivax sp.]